MRNKLGALTPVDAMTAEEETSAAMIVGGTIDDGMMIEGVEMTEETTDAMTAVIAETIDTGEMTGETEAEIVVAALGVPVAKLRPN